MKAENHNILWLKVAEKAVFLYNISRMSVNWR